VNAKGFYVRVEPAREGGAPKVLGDFCSESCALAHFRIAVAEAAREGGRVECLGPEGRIAEFPSTSERWVA
jgi:hypothetical protein